MADDDRGAKGEESAKPDAGRSEVEEKLRAAYAGAEQAVDDEAPPEPSSKHLRAAGFGCIWLIALSAIGGFIFVRSALNTFQDPTDGLVPLEEQARQAEAARRLRGPEQPYEASEASEIPQHSPRRVAPEPPTWPTDYAAQRALASAEGRALIVVFSADYASDSETMLRGTLADSAVARELQRSFRRVHIDTDETTEHPAAELCGVDFLPHICYLDPRTREKLAPDTTELTDPDTMLATLQGVVAAMAARRTSP